MPCGVAWAWQYSARGWAGLKDPRWLHPCSWHVGGMAARSHTAVSLSRSMTAQGSEGMEAASPVHVALPLHSTGQSFTGQLGFEGRGN